MLSSPRRLPLLAASLVLALAAATPAFAAKKKKKPGPGPAAKAAAVPVKAEPIQVRYAEMAKFLVTISYGMAGGTIGNAGGGSGFLIKRPDGVFCVTNQHVLNADLPVTLQTEDGKSLKVTRVLYAKDRDIAMFQVPDATDGFPVAERPQETARLGAPIDVLGNSHAGGVMTALSGKLKAIGPILVEVDAPYVAGNSGGPVILTNQGKVICVATYASRRSLGSLEGDAPFGGIRRFGVRIDNLGEMEARDMNAIRQEAAAVAAIQKRTDAIRILVDDIQKRGAITQPAYQGPDNPLRKLVNDYFSVMHGAAMGDTDRQKVQRRFMQDLFSKSDITRLEELRPSFSTREKLAQEQQQRAAYQRALELRGEANDFSGQKPAKKPAVKTGGSPFPTIPTIPR